MATKTEDFQVPGLVFTGVLYVVALIAIAMFPPLSFACAFYASLRVARWSIGTGRNQQWAGNREVIDGIRLVDYLAWPAIGATGVLSVLAYLTKGWDGGWQQWIGNAIWLPYALGMLATVVLPVLGGVRWQRASVAEYRTVAAWSQTIGALLGMNETAVAEQCSIVQDPDGSVHVGLTPAAAGKAADRAALETRLQAVAPEFEIDPTSDHRTLVIRPVSYETAARRDTLAQTGGLISGGLAPTTANAPTAARSTGGLHLSLEDLQ